MFAMKKTYSMGESNCPVYGYGPGTSGFIMATKNQVYNYILIIERQILIGVDRWV